MNYDFDTIIARRGTDCEKWDLPAEDGVLPLWVADMDFRAAPAIVDALCRRVEEGVFGYARQGLDGGGASHGGRNMPAARGFRHEAV